MLGCTTKARPLGSPSPRGFSYEESRGASEDVDVVIDEHAIMHELGGGHAEVGSKNLVDKSSN